MDPNVGRIAVQLELLNKRVLDASQKTDLLAEKTDLIAQKLDALIDAVNRLTELLAHRL